MSRDPYRYFRVEARELLEQMTQAALVFEKTSVGGDELAAMMRIAHTLKGAARVVKQREIADQAHKIEDLLAPHREVEEPLTAAEVEAILQGIGLMRERLGALEQPAATDAAEARSEAVAAHAATPAASAPFEPSFATSVAPAPKSEEIDRVIDALEAAGAECARIGAALGKLGALRDGALLGQRSLQDSAQQLMRELGEASEAARRLRLQRVGEMFLGLEVTARDAAHSIGVRVNFVSAGKDERLDAKMYSVMQQALVQCVRNAVAHGIEPDEVRRSAGKPVPATITVQVVPRGRRTIFTCRDDGRGIDLDAVRAALQARDGDPGRVAAMSKEQLLQALLTSRLSTAGTVTQLAGRGIGLDVMRQAAESLGGSLAVNTEPGAGTSIEFDLPTSIAAVDALLVETAGRTVAIPLRAVRRTLRVAAEDLAHSPRGAALMFDGNVVPFAPLARALRQTKLSMTAGMSTTAVLVEREGVLAAIGIDRLRGTQNLIVRPLPEFAECDAVVAGASLTAEGVPQLMLDPERLVDFVREAGADLPVASPERLPVLVIDDSLTTRMLEQSILESAGYEVDTAVCAEDGLVQAHRRRYALILVDVEMPGMDGFSFVERIRADAELKDIPAILVTSRSAAEDRARGLRVGANGYIVKGNFDQGELLDSIRRLVRAR